METDISISAIAKAHPRNAKPIPAERAICDQIERLMRVNGQTFKEVTAYLMQRTKLYAECVSRWPKDRREFIVESQNWFMQGCYAADESLWEYHGKENGNGKMKEPGVFDWKQDMIDHPENYVQGKNNGRH